MSAWFWLKGISGPAAHEGWFKAHSYQIGRGTAGRVSEPTLKQVSVTLAYDGSSSQLYEAWISNRALEAANLFVEPLTHYVFTDCNILTLSVSPNRDFVSCNLAFEKLRVGHGA